MNEQLSVKMLEQRLATIVEKVRNLPQEILKDRNAIEAAELRLAPMQEELSMLDLAIEANNLSDLEEKRRFILASEIKNLQTSVRKYHAQIDKMRAELAGAENLQRKLIDQLSVARDLHGRKVRKVMLDNLKDGVADKAREAFAELVVDTCVRHSLTPDDIVHQGIINSYLESSSGLLTKRSRELMREKYVAAEAEVGHE